MIKKNRQAKSIRISLFYWAVCAFSFAAIAAAGGAVAQGVKSPHAFTLADYYQWRDDTVAIVNPEGDAADAAGLSFAADDADTADDANPARQSRPFHLHPADIIDLRGFVINAANGNDDALPDFYRSTRLRLLSSLENQLSRHSEDFLLSGFSAVRSAEVDFHSRLGDRPTQIAVNVVGALVEGRKNSLGWQARIFGSSGDGSGFNLGVFQRRRTSESTYIGANFFLDYAQHEAGNFFRYSAGGEMHAGTWSLAANYYLPITDPLISGDTRAFTREGYDFRFRLFFPWAEAEHVNAALDYYDFQAEGTAPGVRGIRYGLDWLFLSGLKIGVRYDNEKREVGGDISYVYAFDDKWRPPAADDDAFAAAAPDLFVPVLREHWQRITAVTVVPERVIVQRMPIIAAATVTVTTPAGVNIVQSRTMVVDALLNQSIPIRIEEFHARPLVTLPPVEQRGNPLLVTVNNRTKAL